MNKKYFIIPIVVLIQLCILLGCGGGIYDSDDFGTPPTPGSCFCDPDGVETYLKWLQAEYPEFTALRSIGSSEDGRSIWVLEISDEPESAEEEPRVMMNGGIHGDEQLAVGICLKAAEYILEAYNIYLNPAEWEDSLLTETQLAEAAFIVENYRLHIMPALNPDGLDSGSRLNTNYVDLNRNFGYNWDEDEINNGRQAFDQAESAAVRDDFTDNGYSLSMNLHTAAYTENIGIYAPWDAIRTDEPDFIETYLPNYLIIAGIGSDYADSLTGKAHPFSSYFHYDEGADWYVMNGSMADWSLGTLGTVSYTIELYGAQNFTVDDSDLLDEVWNAHRSALINLIKTAELGSGGLVTGSGGSPVAGASISLDCIDSGSKAFVPIEYSKLIGSSATDGSFRFLTGEGNYHITISKTGYQSIEYDLNVDGTGLTSVDGGPYEFFPEYSILEY